MTLSSKIKIMLERFTDRTKHLLYLTETEYYFFKYFVVENTLILLEKSNLDCKLRQIIPAAYLISYKYILDETIPEDFISELSIKFLCNIYTIKKYEILIFKEMNFQPFQFFENYCNTKNKVLLDIKKNHRS